ncbi:MAG TPA: YdeI/OmpD-associated family protein [Ohtaekwangia sp.]|nr:YdeI/OmpD-associated family protein [Ohtaekwangia sp.]
MAAITYSAKIEKFTSKGEKSGWSYIAVSPAQAEKLKPKSKVSFRVKGRLDDTPLKQVALLPMGDGSFILPVNASMRKSLGKKAGDNVKVQLEADERPLRVSKDFLVCLKDDERAYTFFQTLPRSHQLYFSKWIDSAKTAATKSKRITMAIIGLSQQQGFGEMIRANKNNPL